MTTPTDYLMVAASGACVALIPWSPLSRRPVVRIAQVGLDALCFLIALHCAAKAVEMWLR